MRHIDFLPAHYHEKAAKRKTKVWRCSVVVLFGSAVAITAVIQYFCQLEARRQLAQIDSLYLQAQAQKQLHAKIQADYAEAQQDAALYAYLKFPWPRTQILSQIVGSLPEAIKLGDIRLSQEVKEVKGAKPATTPTPPTEPEATAVPGALAQADLKKLRTDNDSQDTVVYISGLTTDPTALHEYVATLIKAPLLQKVELRSLESDPEARRSDADASRFNLRIVVRPGYGQPNGPTAPVHPYKSPEADIVPNKSVEGGTTPRSNREVAASDVSNSERAGGEQ